jgi:hypothetical protein
LPASWNRRFWNTTWKVDTVFLKCIITMGRNNDHRDCPVCNFCIEDNLMTEGLAFLWRIVTRDQHVGAQTLPKNSHSKKSNNMKHSIKIYYSIFI